MNELKKYIKYYNLEEYLFGEVSENFKERGFLMPDEFFCIVIWKANRAKTNIKKKLLSFDSDLARAVKAFTNEIYTAKTSEEKLAVAIKWKFGLPMASAILTVLYPNDFTIYDARVRDIIGIEKDFSGAKDQAEKYFREYIPKVRATSEGNSLREKDQYLWGESFYKDIKKLVG